MEKCYRSALRSYYDNIIVIGSGALSPRSAEIDRDPTAAEPTYRLQRPLRPDVRIQPVEGSEFRFGDARPRSWQSELFFPATGSFSLTEQSNRDTGGRLFPSSNSRARLPRTIGRQVSALKPASAVCRSGFVADAVIGG